MEAVSYKTTIEKKDVIRFNIYYAFFGRRLYYLGLMIFLFGLGVWGIVYEASFVNPDISSIVIFALATILPIIIFLRLIFRSIQVYESQKLNGMEMEYIFSDEGITHIMSRGQILRSYSDLYDIRENKESIYIFSSKISAMFLEKKKLGPEKTEKIKQFLRTNNPQLSKHLKK